MIGRVTYSPDLSGLWAHQPLNPVRLPNPRCGTERLPALGPTALPPLQAQTMPQAASRPQHGIPNSWAAGRRGLRCVQKSPVQPGVQWQVPSSALQLAPLWQLHVWKQAGPQKPGGQAGDGQEHRVRARQRGEEGKGGREEHVRAKMPGGISWLSGCLPCSQNSSNFWPAHPGFSLSPPSLPTVPARRAPEPSLSGH